MESLETPPFSICWSISSLGESSPKNEGSKLNVTLFLERSPLRDGVASKGLMGAGVRQDGEREWLKLGTDVLLRGSVSAESVSTDALSKWMNVFLILRASGLEQTLLKEATELAAVPSRSSLLLKEANEEMLALTEAQTLGDIC
jgi:hypothetical protein